MSAMMGQPKPFASLSSGLLARKGHAKPAMRPQGFGGFGGMSASMDDLGWNDMGQSEPNAEPAGIPVQLAPVDNVAVVPPVLHQREQLREEIETTIVVPVPSVDEPVATVPTPAPTLTAAAAPREVALVRPGGRAKAAFTLRLDQDRHLRLRLASAMSHRSSQQLVTESLDNFLKTLPEVEAMALGLSSRADN